MKTKIIYAESENGINRLVCNINDKKLELILEECKKEKCEVLFCLIKLLLNANSKIYLSYTLNNIMNFIPSDFTEYKLYNKIISNITIEKQNKKIDLMKTLLDYYNKDIFGLFFNYKDKDSVKLPYVYYNK